MFARARHHGTVIDMESFMRLLRYNSPKDPMAQGNACNAISARCDLNPMWKSDYECFGAVDAKVIQARQHFDNLSFFAVSSPTFDLEERPFSWSRQNVSVGGCRPEQHLGHPDTFNFSWYTLASQVDQASESEERLSGEASAEAALLSTSLGSPALTGAVAVLAAALAAAFAAVRLRVWTDFVGSCGGPERQGYVQIDA